MQLRSKVGGSAYSPRVLSITEYFTLHPWVGHQSYHPDFCILACVHTVQVHGWKLNTIFFTWGAVSLNKKNCLASLWCYTCIELVWCKVEICNFLLHKRWNSGKYFNMLTPQRIELCEYSFACLCPTTCRTLPILICMFVPHNECNFSIVHLQVCTPQE